MTKAEDKQLNTLRNAYDKWYDGHSEKVPQMFKTGKNYLPYGSSTDDISAKFEETFETFIKTVIAKYTKKGKINRKAFNIDSNLSDLRYLKNAFDERSYEYSVNFGPLGGGAKDTESLGFNNAPEFKKLYDQWKMLYDKIGKSYRDTLRFDDPSNVKNNTYNVSELEKRIEKDAGTRYIRLNPANIERLKKFSPEGFDKIKDDLPKFEELWDKMGAIVSKVYETTKKLKAAL